jgi:hypothetical protein
LTELEWPSSTCWHAPHCSSTSGKVLIHIGIRFKNCFLILLAFGLKIIAELYI